MGPAHRDRVRPSRPDGSCGSLAATGTGRWMPPTRPSTPLVQVRARFLEFNIRRSPRGIDALGRVTVRIEGGAGGPCAPTRRGDEARHARSRVRPTRIIVAAAKATWLPVNNSLRAAGRAAAGDTAMQGKPRPRRRSSVDGNGHEFESFSRVRRFALKQRYLCPPPDADIRVDLLLTRPVLALLSGVDDRPGVSRDGRREGDRPPGLESLSLTCCLRHPVRTRRRGNNESPSDCRRRVDPAATRTGRRACRCPAAPPAQERVTFARGASSATIKGRSRVTRRSTTSVRAGGRPVRSASR